MALGDSLWWDAGGFAQITGPFSGFHRVIRGFSRKDEGILQSINTRFPWILVAALAVCTQLWLSMLGAE